MHEGIKFMIYKYMMQNIKCLIRLTRNDVNNIIKFTLMFIYLSETSISMFNVRVQSIILRKKKTMNQDYLDLINCQ